MKIEFSTRLRKLRQKKGISMRELADRTKISYFTLVSLELRRSKVPTLHTVAVLAKFFKMSLDEFLKNVRIEEPKR